MSEEVEVDESIGPVTFTQWAGVGVLFAKNISGAFYYTFKYWDALMDRHILVKEQERLLRLAMQRDIESIVEGRDG